MFKLFRRLGLQKDRGSEDALKLIRIDQAMLNMLDKRYRIYRIRVRELAPYQQVLYGGHWCSASGDARFKRVFWSKENELDSSPELFGPTFDQEDRVNALFETDENGRLRAVTCGAFYIPDSVDSVSAGAGWLLAAVSATPFGFGPY